MRRTDRRRPRRAAFTLIELLVVILIITILVALSAAAVLRIIGVQQTSNSKTALTKVQAELNKQWSAAAARFEKETPPFTDPNLNAVYNNVVMPLAQNDRKRARVIWVKLRLKQMFPQTMDEVFNPLPGDLPPLEHNVDGLTTLGYNPYSSSPPAPPGTPIPIAPEHSSILLLSALTRGEGGNQLSGADLGISASLGTGTTPNGMPVSYLIDGYGQPLAFCRWPTGSTVLNPNGPQQGLHDSGDPTGLLTNAQWLATTGAQQFQVNCHALPPRTAANEPQSYRLAPLVASPGPDKTLGLDPRTFAQLPGAAYQDNLYPVLQPNP
jgi:prepilin-type N-terminal cleavage/methylation domain-containing protein